MVLLAFPVLKEVKVTQDLLDLWDYLVNEVHLVFLVLKVNVEVKDSLDPKVLPVNRVNVVCKVLWVLLVLLENQLKEVMLDLPDPPVNLVLVV